MTPLWDRPRLHEDTEITQAEERELRAAADRIEYLSDRDSGDEHDDEDGE